MKTNQASEELLPKKIIYLAMLVLTAVIWGSGFVAVKIALNEGANPFFMSGARFIIAAVILAGVLQKKIFQISRKTYSAGGVIGALLFLGFIFQTIGQQYTTVTNNAFITAVYVVIVPFLYWVLYKKRPRVVQFICAGISLLGIRFLSFGFQFRSNNSIQIGDLLVFICAIFFAMHIIMLGFYAKKHSPIVLAFLQMLVAGIISIVLMLIFEPLPTLTIKSILAILFLGIFSSCLAFTLQSIAQKHLSQITVSLVISLESLFGTMFSVLLLQEKITPAIILGGILILAAIIFSEIKFSR